MYVYRIFKTREEAEAQYDRYVKDGFCDVINLIETSFGPDDDGDLLKTSVLDE